METKAAAVLNAVPPYGHVITSEKWRNSSLIQSLKGNFVIYLKTLNSLSALYCLLCGHVCVWRQQSVCQLKNVDM